MEQGLSNLLSLLTSELYQPFQRQIANTPWLLTLLRNLNTFINSFLDMFHDNANSLNIDIINDKTLASTLTLVILIYLLTFIIKTFKYAFRILNNAIDITPATGSSKEWRKQWKRRK